MAIRAKGRFLQAPLSLHSLHSPRNISVKRRNKTILYKPNKLQNENIQLILTCWSRLFVCLEASTGLLELRCGWKIFEEYWEAHVTAKRTRIMPLTLWKPNRNNTKQSSTFEWPSTNNNTKCELRSSNGFYKTLTISPSRCKADI